MSAPLPAPALIDSIYREHHGWLLGWFLRRLSGSSQAADLAHDTFIRLITSRELAQVREPRAFLRTLAHGVIVNHWRRADVERAWAEAVAAQPELLAPSPEERMIAVEMLCRIDAMLNTLSDKARKAFLLSQIDGRTYAEIALELGVSDRMVKKYMAQAMLQCLVLAQEP